METLKDFKIKLEEKINDCEQVFLTPHKKADFDAIASCIGMALIVKKLGKKPYIIMDEEPLAMEPGVKKIVEEIKIMPINKEKELISVISSDKYKKIKSESDLLVALDLNKTYLTSCESYLDAFKDIVVIDHHKEDESTIPTENKFIDITSSSVSEIVAELLCFFSVKYDARIADYLLAGIYLDTGKFTRNNSAKTMKLVTKLMEKGADLARVNELFSEDFSSDRKVQGLVNQTTFFAYTIAFAIANEDVVYNREELAKVADYLLRFQADAAFAMGHISDDTIAISARSKGKVDVGDIMKDMGGGGNPLSAATLIEGTTVEEVGLTLSRKLKPSFYSKKN